MSLMILRAMSSAECTMGLRSFILHDEPLNAGRLRSADSRLYEELEIKNLMRAHSPMANGNASNGRVKLTNRYNTECTSNAGDAASSSGSSSCSTTNGIRRSNHNTSTTSNNSTGHVRQQPSRTPSTASTSLSSNGNTRSSNPPNGNISSTFRPSPSTVSNSRGHVEYTEPTVLISTHRSAPATDARLSNSVVDGVLSTRRDSNASADAEVCALHRRSRTQSGEEAMPDEEEEAAEVGISDEFDRLHLNGSLTRRHISPHSDVMRSLKMPSINKDQVLNYIANTKSLQIRRQGTELQVTDSTGFPLLDVWQKNNWIIESFGRIVLMLHDVGRSWKLWNANRVRSSVLEVEDAENELLGFFVVAEPFVVQNRDRTAVARFNAYDSGDGRSVLFQCVLENSGEEIGRLEPRKSQHSQLRFGQAATGFPLKLLVLAAAVRIASMPQNNNGTNVSNSTSRTLRPKRRNKASCCSIV
ncbi:hypothetical protein M3Y94_01167300 [Aphelenchoides besseyi]|nr:hypothetical protein M3Y94_01167300 [Aphelenchoides besseyi]